jgi:hypothetical protein
LIRIRDHNALDRIRVVGAATKGGRSWLNPNNPCQRIGPTGQVTDDRNPISDDHTLATDIPCLNCVNLEARSVGAPENNGEPSSVYCCNKSLSRIVMGGSFLASRTRLSTSGTYPNIVLVKFASTH